MRDEQKKSRIMGLAALLVLAVFAVCILAVLLSGADVYQRLVDREQRSYDRRTAAQYITTRLRQSDRIDAVAVEDFAGQSALVLRQEIEGENYETRVYCYDGYIRELFAAAGGGFLPEDGEKILKADSLMFLWEEPVLSVEILLDGGGKQDLTLLLRSGGEGEP